MKSSLFGVLLVLLVVMLPVNAQDDTTLLIETDVAFGNDYELYQEADGYKLVVKLGSGDLEYALDFSEAGAIPESLSGMTVVGNYPDRLSEMAVVVWNEDSAYLMEDAGLDTLGVIQEFDLTPYNQMLEVISGPFALTEPCIQNLGVYSQPQLGSNQGLLSSVTLTCAAPVEFGLTRYALGRDTYSVIWGFDSSMQAIQPAEVNEAIEPFDILTDGSEILFATGYPVEFECTEYLRELDFNGELMFEANCSDGVNQTQLFVYDVMASISVVNVEVFPE
jgi:hypothetical protein